MTTLLQEPPLASSPTAEEPRRALLFRLLPWVLVAVAAVVALHWGDTPDKQILIYGAYFVLAVVLPGTLVMRGLFGSRGNWPEDLGVGAAGGLIVQLAGWTLAAATGVEILLPIFLALVVVLFLAVPRLRRHWRIAEPSPLPVGWSWGIAAVLVLVVLWVAGTFRTTPLPPTTWQLYQDILYHLALVHEMTRSMPFQVPQVAGDTLRYHYLSDADMATASMLTGISPVTVYLRLWLIPIAAVSVFVFAALARTISGRWWTGPVGAAAAVVGVGLTLGAPITAFGGGGSTLSVVSPSQMYVLPLIGLFALIAVKVLRGERLGWGGGPRARLGPGPPAIKKKIRRTTTHNL
jgi:hypothetical protein